TCPRSQVSTWARRVVSIAAASRSASDRCGCARLPSAIACASASTYHRRPCTHGADVRSRGVTPSRTTISSGVPIRASSLPRAGSPASVAVSTCSGLDIGPHPARPLLPHAPELPLPPVADDDVQLRQFDAELLGVLG